MTRSRIPKCEMEFRLRAYNKYHLMTAEIGKEVGTILYLICFQVLPGHLLFLSSVDPSLVVHLSLSVLVLRRANGLLALNLTLKLFNIYFNVL